MSKCLLSICIPTANRKSELRNQLLGIAAQVEKLDKKELIQVVIGDNSDVNDQFINLDEFSNLNIKYIRNNKNLGYARNVNNIIKESEGEYSWLLSDDDFLFDNALESILKNISDYSDSNYVTFECGGMFNGKLFNKNMYFKDIEKKYFCDGSEFLEKYWSSIIFVSINIFKREKVLEHMRTFNLLEDVNEVFQNSLIGITFVAEKGEVLVINDPLLNDNYGNKVYSPKNINNVAVDKYCKLIKQLVKANISPKIINEMSRELFANILKYGFYSVIYKIEYESIQEHSEVYRKIYKDKNIALFARSAAIIIYLLLVSNASLAKVGLKIILFFRRRQTYHKVKSELDGIVAYGKSKITSTY